MKKRIIAIILLLSSVSLMLVIQSLFQEEVLDDIRSYVRGESLYSRGHANAVQNLVKYTSTYDENDFNKFLEEISIPLGDKIAREALLLPKPDKETAYKGFLQAENHPVDIHGMIFFFIYFQDIYYVSESIKYWTKADEANTKIFHLGYEIKKIVESGATQDLDIYVNKLYTLANEAQLNQESFSAILSEGARWVKNVLIVTTIVFFLFLMLLALTIIRRIIKDIEKNEYELRTSQERLNYAINGVNDGLYDWNLETDAVYYSPQWFHMIGYEHDEFEQHLRTWAKLVHPDDKEKALEIIQKHIEGSGENFEVEFRMKHKNGTWVYILARGKLIRDTQRNVIEPRRVIGTHVEITKQKELEKELQSAKEKAEDATRAKDNFLASMSHEIRTPMTGILGFIERLLKDEKDSKRLEKLKIVQSSGETLLEIINDILDFSKIESGKLELEFSPYNITEIFESSMNIFASIASSKNISLHRMIDAQLPPCIMGDQTRLKQVVFNLMGNAIKFTNPEGSITLQVRLNSENNTIYIAIVDTGVGIAKENFEKIFQAFSQEDVSTTRKFGGTGLGLTISARLVNLMGSQLKVESKVGEGSKFYFELPLEICSDTTENNTQENHENLESLEKMKGCVLIVEDNKTNQMLLGMILDDAGLNYDVANNGAEAVLNFKYKKYDAILMDENMPIMNGIEAAKHIREIEKEQSLTPTPIIAVTANALTGDKEKFIDAGMDEYISKPFSEDDIFAVLHKFIKR